MTIKQGLLRGAKKLEQKLIERPDLEAELLLAGILHQNRVFLLAHGEQSLTLRQKIKYQALIYLKSQGWPTAYLTGHQEFFGLDFLVNNKTLIPRPETELLVETALKIIPSAGPATVIEVGTGSGCIIVSVVKNNPNQEVNYQAGEISRGALQIAQINASRYEVADKIKFVHGSLLDLVDKSKLTAPLIILANLPYLTPEQVKNSPSIQREPQSALISGSDGLDLYRELLAQTRGLSIKNLTLILEIDPEQSDAITALAKNYWPEATVEILADFRGQNRIAVITNK